MIENLVLFAAEGLVGLPILSLGLSFFLYLLLVQFDFSGPAWQSGAAIGLHNGIKVVVVPLLLFVRSERKALFKPRLDWLAAGWLALIGYAGLAVLWSPARIPAVKEVGYLTSFFLTAVVAVRLLQSRPRWLGRMLPWALVISMLLAVLQTYFTGNRFGAEAGRLTPFVAPKSFAVWLVFGFVLLLWLALRGTVATIWASACSFALGIELVLNSSRAEMGGLALISLAVIAMGWSCPAKERGRILKTGAAALAGIAIGVAVVFVWPHLTPSGEFTTVQARLAEIPPAAEESPSKIGVRQVPKNLSFRMTRYRRALKELGGRSLAGLIIGSGTSSAVSVARVSDIRRWKGKVKRIDANRVVHDAPLRVLLEWGAIGLVILGFLLSRIGLLVVRLFRAAGLREARILALGVVPLAIWILLENPLAAGGSPAGMGAVLWLAALLTVQPAESDGRPARGS